MWGRTEVNHVEENCCGGCTGCFPHSIACRSAGTRSAAESWLLPGNVFYIFDTMFEGIGTFFTFGQESKVRRYLALAEERLAELTALATPAEAEAQPEQVETDRMEQALASYEETLDEAVSTVDEMEADGEEVEGLASEIAEATLKHLEDSCPGL